MRYVITQSQYEKLKKHVEPSDDAVKNVCDSKKFCSAQGKITFGQLRELVEVATKKRIFKHVSEGGFKAILRLIPWFLPQLSLAGFVGSAARALNKVLRPTITETTNYRTWWGKVVMKSFDLVEGDLNLTDPFSRIFFISDGLMTMLDDRYKIKFAKYISEIASIEPDDKEVPEFFVENELRRWLNEKFLLDPPLRPKTKIPKRTLKVSESELIDLVGMIIESNEDINLIMKRRHGGFLQSIQKQIEKTDPNMFGDEFEYADNIISWALDDIFAHPGDEWLEDRRDDLLDYAKEEFGDQLFDFYYSATSEEEDDEFGENITEQFNREQLYRREDVVRMLIGAPAELRRLIKKLPSIDCENNKGEKTICTKIPETIHVYLTGRY